MSADNRICIMYDYPYRQWAVWNGSGSCEYYEPPGNSKHFDTEKEATEYAHAEELRISYVEYGVQRIGVDEQRSALIYQIEDLANRLAELARSGFQFKSRMDENDD